MTIDEKIKQAVEEHIKKATENRCSPKSSKYQEHKDFVCQCQLADWLAKSANFVKSEMLADMQKLVEALEFYADMAKDDNESLDDCLERACIDRAESKEYNLSGKYVAEKAVKALAEFNAKYKVNK